MAREKQESRWRSYKERKAAEVDANWKVSPISAETRDLFVSLLQSAMPPPCRVLDVGCGSGEVTIALHDVGYHVTGLDISPAFLELFRVNIGERSIPVICDNLFSAPAAHEYDAATVRYLFSHYVGFEELLDGILRYVRPGGIIVFDSFATEALELATNIRGPQEPASALFSGHNHFSDAQLRSACEARQLEIVTRQPALFFHRNPLLADPAAPKVYDAEFIEHLRNPAVRAFARWVSAKAPSILGSSLIATVLRRHAE